ncbi:hypothetical protein PENTCL1PPCAC_15657, partial [Pristionchus entomophagus]
TTRGDDADFDLVIHDERCYYGRPLLRLARQVPWHHEGPLAWSEGGAQQRLARFPLVHMTWISYLPVVWFRLLLLIIIIALI